MDLQSKGEANPWLKSYDDYLRDVVGTTATTRIRYARVIRRFVCACCDDDSGWAGLSVQTVTDFVCDEAATKQGRGRGIPLTAVRSFLRFLAWRGAVPSGLDYAIPRARLARHASLPRRISVDQVEQLLEAAKGSKAPIRDRAILLLLVRLGLRCSEIVALSIDDLDWRAGLLRVGDNKSRRERKLPLPQDVGAALADYIMNSRPREVGRDLFIGVNTPPAPFRVPTAITCMVKRCLRRAGLPLGRLSGAHMLRHTAASGLVNNGASFREVADLLGHQSLKTTMIYAKLDLPTLAGVSMPWIGGGL